MKQRQIHEAPEPKNVKLSAVGVNESSHHEYKCRAHPTVTSVQLTPQSISQIVTNLGVAYDLMKIIDTQRLETNAHRFRLHVDLLNVLQKAGFAKIGLPTQEFITEKNKPKWSKSCLTKLFAAKTFLTSELSTVLVKASGRAAPTCTGKQVSNVLDHLLGKKEFLECEGSAKELESRRATSKWRLDPWQIAMTNYITQGQSVLVNSPTSTGKTFTAMIAIDWLLTKRSDIRLAYIAPTFHLALQTYANIKLTFPQPVSLVTGVANAIVADAQVWVGTPLELWAYLQSTQTSFSIGIFDEIHSLSASFSSGQNKLHQLRAECLSNLLGLCTDQVIALSATIHADDIDILQKYISKRTGIDSIQTVVHTERSVPTTSFIWTGTELERMDVDQKTFKLNDPMREGKRSTIPSIPAETTAAVTGRITPKATFTLLRLLSERDMLPSLVFDVAEKICFDSFVEYVDWIEKEETRVYHVWHNISDTLGAEIKSYNDASAPYYSDYSSAFNLNKTTSAKENKSTALKELLPRVRQYSKERCTLLDRVLTVLSSEIVKLVSKHETEYMVPVSADLCKTLNKIKVHGEFRVPGSVSVQCRDLIKEWQTFAELHVPMSDPNTLLPDSISALPQVAYGVGSFFRIGVRAPEVDTIRDMLVPGASTEKWKLRKSMQSLCQAERIRTKEVEPLFKMIARGLEYGVALILPSIPFVAQYEMLRLLSKRSLKVIFTSQSMSMGVNYPVRCAVIRASVGTSIDVMMYMQMSGRAGRRRLDDKGFVVSWNVENAANANLSTLPRIVLPLHGENRGVLVQDPDKVASQIDLSQDQLLCPDALTLALSLLGTGPRNGTGTATQKQQQQSKAGHKSLVKNKLARPFKLRGQKLANKNKKISNATHDSDEPDHLLPASKQSLDDTGAIAAITACLHPLASALDLSEADIAGIAERIRGVAVSNIENIRQDTYTWVEKMNLCKTALAELHTRFHLSGNTSLLQYIADIYEILHRVSYRLLRLRGPCGPPLNPLA